MHGPGSLSAARGQPREVPALASAKVPAGVLRPIAAGGGAGAIALKAPEALGVPLVAISVQDDAE